MVVPGSFEHEHLHNLTSVPSWFFNAQVIGEHKKTFTKKMSANSLFIKKQELLGAVSVANPVMSIGVLQELLEIIQQQRGHVQQSGLTPLKRNIDTKGIPVKTLGPHMQMLKAYYGRHFAQIEHALYLGNEVDEHTLQLALSSVADAYHVEQIKQVLVQQYNTITRLLQQVQSGGSDTIDKRKQVLHASLDDELTNVVVLQHHEPLVKLWK